MWRSKKSEELKMDLPLIEVEEIEAIGHQETTDDGEEFGVFSGVWLA